MAVSCELEEESGGPAADRNDENDTDDDDEVLVTMTQSERFCHRLREDMIQKSCCFMHTILSYLFVAFAVVSVVLFVCGLAALMEFLIAHPRVGAIVMGVIVSALFTTYFICHCFDLYHADYIPVIDEAVVKKVRECEMKEPCYLVDGVDCVIEATMVVQGVPSNEEDEESDENK